MSDQYNPEAQPVAPQQPAAPAAPVQPVQQPFAQQPGVAPQPVYAQQPGVAPQQQAQQFIVAQKDLSILGGFLLASAVLFIIAFIGDLYTGIMTFQAADAVNKLNNSFSSLSSLYGGSGAASYASGLSAGATIYAVITIISGIALGVAGVLIFMKKKIAVFVSWGALGLSLLGAIVSLFISGDIAGALGAGSLVIVTGIISAVVYGLWGYYFYASQRVKNVLVL